MSALGRALIALVVAATLAFTTAGSAALGCVYLPRDHYAHPQTGIEWRYATGIVRGEDGHRYSVFYTLFRRMGFVLPISQVVDLDTGALVGHSETLAPAVLGTKKLDVTVPGGGLRYRRRMNTWQFSAADSADTYALSLRATPQKRYACTARDGHHQPVCRWAKRLLLGDAHDGTRDDHEERGGCARRRCGVVRPPVGELRERSAGIQLGLVLLPL